MAVTDPTLYWTELSAIALSVAAIGTFLAPLFALQVSAWLARRREQRRQRLDLYQILMQWRAAPFVEAPVRVFNSIDTVFHDVRQVREAWADLYSSYLDLRLSTTEGGRIRQDKLKLLLQRMADHLGYRRTFSGADFERVYNPEVLGRHYSILLEQQRQTFETLFGRRSSTEPIQQQQPAAPPPQQIPVPALPQQQQAKGGVEQGYYMFNYQGATGFGFGCMKLESGRITGFDFLRGRYDGTYQRDQSGAFHTQITMSFPQGVVLITGTPAPEIPVELTGTFPPTFWAGTPFPFTALGGAIQVSMVKMRDLAPIQA